jgi:non-ribosomal peptide synthase protein (TIGR01720 family)
VDGEWRQHNDPVRPGPVLARRDLSRADDGRQDAALAEIGDEVQAGFDLATGPLFKAVLLRRGGGQRPLLFLVAHHLVMDGVSWRILLDDLDRAYRQAVRGESVDLGARTTSYRDWSTRLAEYVAGGGLDHEVEHWSGALEGCALPVDHSGTAAAEDEERVVSVALDVEDTDALLRAAPTAYRTRVNDVLLAALAWALSRWTGRRTVSVDLEGHGREEVLDGVDLSRTVGWFTTIFPVALTVPDGQPPWRDLVRSVRRQLRAVPGNGFGFGALRYLGPAEVRQRLANSGQAPQISFNYLGQWDGTAGESGLYRAAHESIGADHDPTDRGPHLLEVVGSVQGGRLELSWHYRPDRHERSTVAAVAGELADALRAIAQDCREPR